jgi:hypothetical protein
MILENLKRIVSWRSDVSLLLIRRISQTRLFYLSPAHSMLVDLVKKMCLVQIVSHHILCLKHACMSQVFGVNRLVSLV